MTGKKKYSVEICSVQDLLVQIDKSGLSRSHHAHVRVWFRGHSNDGWELQPGVYRQNFPRNDEPTRLRTEQHMTQDFRVESAGLLTGRETDAELYFLQQHYRMPTRLLDWTQNPLAALYFSAGGNPSCNGSLFMMDAYQLLPSQRIEDFQGIATSRSPLFRQALRPILEWGKADDFPKAIIPVRPDHFDPRITRQRSCFTFHVRERHVLTEAENPSLLSFVIPAAVKDTIMKELFLLGVDPFTVFGDLESLCQRLKLAYDVPL
jgi:FRG domain